MPRTIKKERAVRENMPLNIGLWGPSGCGKTFTALRLATGIQKVFPGEIVLIDTENGRGKHYADIFEYSYVSFDPPFNSLDYLDVLKQVEAMNPSVIIVDSFSHEHEGNGGYIETQSIKAKELAEKWRTTPDKTTMPAWAHVAGQRKELLLHIQRMKSNLISCFRAKEKNVPTKDGNGKTKIENLGYMPVAGKEFVFEMTLSALLPPGSKGFAVFQTGNKGEDLMTKLPEQFRSIFEGKEIQLSEHIGQQLAMWAKGDEKTVPKSKQFPREPEHQNLDIGEPYGLIPQLEQWSLSLEGSEAAQLIIKWAATQDEDTQESVVDALNSGEDFGIIEVGIVRAYFRHPILVNKMRAKTDVREIDHFEENVKGTGAAEVHAYLEKVFQFMRSNI